MFVFRLLELAVEAFAKFVAAPQALYNYRILCDPVKGLSLLLELELLDPLLLHDLNVLGFQRLESLL